MDIDGVFSGGGIKGFALIGSYKVIEQKGFKFRRLAGTSAGSIIAALIIAGYTSDEIYDLMVNLNMEEFLDDRFERLPFPFAKWLMLYWRLGLYKGDLLEQWLEEQLAKKGVKTFADIPAQSLRVIASDLSAGKMIVLPDDLKDYGINPQRFSVAKAVRASCSIPYFFEPVKFTSDNGANIIVDGGVLSNFPMWLFANEKIRKRPVLGVKLANEHSEQEYTKIKGAIQLFTALFETMRTAHDSRYISNHHVKDIVFIPTSDTLATEFKIDEEKRKKLIETGAKYTEDFLKTWSY